jgi:hypothetical protein
MTARTRSASRSNPQRMSVASLAIQIRRGDLQGDETKCWEPAFGHRASCFGSKKQFQWLGNIEFSSSTQGCEQSRIASRPHDLIQFCCETEFPPLVINFVLSRIVRTILGRASTAPKAVPKVFVIISVVPETRCGM